MRISDRSADVCSSDLVKSTSPDPDFRPLGEGQQALITKGPGGKPKTLTVASDGIALSADGKTLYFCPLSSRHLYSVPTTLLRDPNVSEAQLAAAVQDLGEKGASDRSEEHTSDLQSLMRISYAVSCLTKKQQNYA